MTFHGKVDLDCSDRIDPQLSPWALERNRNMLAASLEKVAEADLPAVLADILTARLGRHDAGNVLTRADRIVRDRA